MPTRMRRGLRFARRSAWYIAAAILVAMALGAVLAKQGLSMLERNPERIAQWLSARADRPVTFDSVQTEWTRRGPLLRLDGLKVGEGGGVLVGEAEILVAQYEGLLPGRSFTELRIRGLQLTLQRDDEGRWHVRGLPGQDTAGDPFAALEGLGELQVVGSRLSIDAPQLGIKATLPRIDVRMRVNGPRVRAAARAWMREGVSPLDIVVDIDRDKGDGRAHASAAQVDLSAWSELVQYGGIVAQGGSGRAQAWLALVSHRIESVIVDAALDAVVLRGAPVATGGEPPQQRIETLSMLARLQMSGRDWRIDAPRLRIEQRDASQSLDGLLIASGERQVLRAEQVNAGPLLAALSLSDRLPAGLRRWLLASAPDALLQRVDISGVRGGPLQVHARIEGLRFATVGDTPGLSGLGGELSGDSEGFAFDFDRAGTVRFDWPSGFGPPHDIKLHGGIVGWRDGEGIRIETPALRIDGDGYAANARGGMGFQNDGSRPSIDIAATLDEVNLPIAKRFWVRHLMPDAAEHWLDAALVGGKLRSGHAVISGDLDDWPFSTREQAQAKGIFHAEGELVGAMVKFQPDWPAAERIDGAARFINDGFVVEGTAQIADVPVTALRAELPHYGDASLLVRARSQSDGSKLLTLLQQSPLHDEHADSLDNLTVSGPVAATFALDLPLGNGGTPKINGRVELQEAKLADARWKLAFERVTGAVQYDQHGFLAEDLAAVREGRPGSLSLRAGVPHVRDASHAFEAELDAVLPASDLLSQAPELGWLAPHVQGRSRWNVAVAIPNAQSSSGAMPARVRLRSDLVGTTLALPQPLRKAEQEALRTTVDTTLPLDDGEVMVSFGNRLALRARAAQGRTGVRVMLGASSVEEAPPPSGLVATGRTTELDAMEWATFASGGDEGEGLALRGIDVTADRLQLLGSSFPQTRVVASPDGAATRVLFEGRALAGTLHVPKSSRDAVVGRIDRLHWASAEPFAKAASTPRTEAPSDDGIDPANIPPLQIDVADLRFGALSLGTASLRTRPTQDGLSIERLQARSADQRLDVTGAWTGRGASARTRLGVGIDSADFGALIEGFGFGKRIHGGKGELRFEASWPQSPAAFDIGTLQGSLAVTVKDGRLAEVEPGAGRVLGLLSVAELPRRLMLDFRDFFSSGFAFNRIGGNVSFAGGEARSDNLVIDGPAAELRIQGRSNLRAQTHDQRIDVLPKTGNLLPAVGAIAGGPIGAAVGAVANAVLKGPLGELNAKSYHVTGTWQDPKVEVTDHQPPARTRAQQGNDSTR